MTTWQGALIQIDNQQRFMEAAEKYRISVESSLAPWILVEVPPQLGRLGPPAFSKQLSEELQTTIVAFFLQTTVSNERVEHWESGRLIRALEFHLDGGGWIEKQGSPQSWEADYFFSETEGTAEGETWPSNLGDEVSDDDIKRFEEARKRQKPHEVMDLLMGGSMERLCQHFDVDPSGPKGRYTPPPNLRPHLLGMAVFAVFAIAILAAVLTTR